MLHRLIPVLILLFAQSARAGVADGWPEETRALIGRHNRTLVARYDLVSGNPFLISLVDHLALRVRGWGGPAPGGRGIEVLAKTGAFRDFDGRPRPLALTYWEGAADAPWAVYLPGIFQGSNDEDTHRMVDMLREVGYRVLVIPDPLGREYMSNLPVAPPAGYAREAAIVREVVAEVLARFGGSEARLIAASHGAVLAARAWAADQEATRQYFTDASLLFPQADLGHAVRLIDGYITTPFRSDPPRALIGAAFQESLRKLVKRLQRTYLGDLAAGFRARAYPTRATGALSRYRRSDAGRTLTFRRVLDDYVARDEVLAAFDGREDRLLYWLEKGHAARGASSVRVIVGTDDWTNAPDAWTALPAWLADGRHLAVIERAGHAGLVAESWFRRAVQAAMAWR